MGYIRGNCSLKSINLPDAVNTLLPSLIVAQCYTPQACSHEGAVAAKAPFFQTKHQIYCEKVHLIF